MASTIRLNDTDIDIAKRAAQINNRSTAGQIAHWMTIGRIIEQSPSYDHDRVESALKAELEFDDLSADEQTIALERFHNSMRSLNESDEAAFLAEIDAVETPTSLGVFGVQVMDDFAAAMQDKFFHDELSQMSWINEIKKQGLINRQGERGFTLLMLAALSDRALAVQKLISAGADITVADESGNTPVHVAARMNKINVLMCLLANEDRKRFDIVNVKTRVSALMEAVIAGRQTNTKVLSNPVSVRHKDRAGNTALHFAVGPARVQIAQLLLRAGADPFETNNNAVSFSSLFESENVETMTADYREAFQVLRKTLGEIAETGTKSDSAPAVQQTIQSAG